MDSAVGTLGARRVPPPNEGSVLPAESKRNIPPLKLPPARSLPLAWRARVRTEFTLVTFFTTVPDASRISNAEEFESPWPPSAIRPSGRAMTA